MSKLVRPREITERKRSQRKDSEAKASEIRTLMERLVTSPEYTHIKRIAASIASGYRTAPGGTREENESYLTHCTILWAYNMMWKIVEDTAKLHTMRKTQNGNDGW